MPDPEEIVAMFKRFLALCVLGVVLGWAGLIALGVTVVKAVAQ